MTDFVCKMLSQCGCGQKLRACTRIDNLLPGYNQNNYLSLFEQHIITL